MPSPPPSPPPAAVSETFVAVGTESGHVLLLRPSCRAVACEFALHQSPVGGLLWASPSLLLSFSSSGGGSGGSSAGEAGGGTWRNVVLALSLPEGDVRELAPPRGSEAAPLVGLRLSPSGARLLLLYREAPPRMLDTRTAASVGEHVLPTLPPASAVEWLPPLSATPLPATPASRASAPGAAVASAPSRGSADSSTPDAPAEALLLTIPDGSTVELEVRGSRILARRSASPAAVLAPPPRAPASARSCLIASPLSSAGGAGSRHGARSRRPRCVFRDNVWYPRPPTHDASSLTKHACETRFKVAFSVSDSLQVK